jgi:hypothetical protein
MHTSLQRVISICITFSAVLSLITSVPAAQGASGDSTIYLPVISNSTIPPIVFVSRQIMNEGSIYWDPPKGMPGVGAYSRFTNASPGKLQIYRSTGGITTLIDGSNPAANAFRLIDVNAPDVSYDARQIVFAGLPQGNFSRGTVGNPGAWRLYIINSDGTGLRQLTTSNQQLNMSQFGPAAGSLSAYDDTDPAWLPDGRVVFTSTRWPAYAQYSGVRATNLYVVNADGTSMRRITSERNGADRPVVDPITGQIVYARWWRNHRFPTSDFSTQTNPQGGFDRKDGLTGIRNGATEPFFRNAWQASAINPDGTGLHMLIGQFRDEERNHTYGGSFTADGDFVANYFPMYNMTEAGGFGGIRRYPRGANGYTPLIGITRLSIDYANQNNPTSFGIFKGAYAADPSVLADGRIVFSYTPGIGQDYGLYIMNSNGGNPILLYDAPGTTELRARPLVPRPLPPIIADTITQIPSPLPPTASGPYDSDGTFIFDDLNVYFNAPVDVDIVNAPAVGSAQSIQFFLDHQRTSTGSFPNLDWPILLGQIAVAADGSVVNPNAPANVPLFESLRSADGSVPVTVGQPGQANGAGFVAGMNFGRPGEHARCVGCHAGHSQIRVPANAADAKWTNLATGASLNVSSATDQNFISGLTDRRVMKGETWRYWRSANGQTSNQWVELTFPVPVTVRTVRLYNPRQEANTNLKVGQTTVILFSDAAGTIEVGRKNSGALAVLGTNVDFNEITVRKVRIEINQVSGRVDGITCASLAEVEVIARGEAP